MSTPPPHTSPASPTTDVSASPEPTPASPTPVLPSRSPSPAPCLSRSEPVPGLCVGLIGRVPTSAGFAAMIAAGAPGVEKALGMKDWSVCSNGQACFKAGTADEAMVGTNAGVLDGEFGQYPSGGLGAACWVFVYQDSKGWHYLNSGWAQNPGCSRLLRHRRPCFREWMRQRQGNAGAHRQSGRLPGQGHGR